MNLIAYLAQAAEGGGGASFWGILPPFIMIFAIMYFLIIRPQQKREKERKRMIEQIRKNDHVVTIGGAHGVVTSVSDDEVILRVDDENNVRIKFSRSAIARVVGEVENKK